MLVDVAGSTEEELLREDTVLVDMIELLDDAPAVEDAVVVDGVVLVVDVNIDDALMDDAVVIDALLDDKLVDNALVDDRLVDDKLAEVVPLEMLLVAETLTELVDDIVLELELDVVCVLQLLLRKISLMLSA